VEKQSADGSLVPATRKTAENENDDDDEDEKDWEMTLNTYSCQATIAPSLRDISQ
jgi:hypothetical protein